MPIRAYEPLNPPCRLCGAGFEVVQAAGATPLRECPRCGQAVRLKPAAPAPGPKLLQRPSVSEAKAAGFTVLKRTSGGEFEKL
jgi:predicted nucleic acid-binding Zn ribbon protein